MLFEKASAFQNTKQELHAGVHGMKLFLVSLAMLFGATIVGFFVMRVYIPEWPKDLPPMPWSLAISTILLIVSSGTIQVALRAAQRSDAAGTSRHIMITMGLGLVFLIIQTWAWFTWLDGANISWEGETVERFALTAFYVLTGLHAAHVIGGLIPMGLTWSRAQDGRYNGDHHGAVLYCAMYWHFLDAVWLVLYAVLLVFV